MPGAVDTFYTFGSTDVITSTKLNDILDQSVMTGTAIIGTTLEVTTSGKLKVASQGITSNELSSGSVKTVAIEDGAVTPAKLANSDFGDFTVASGVATLDANVVTTAKILDANVTTAKIKDANITAAKLDGAQTGTAPIYGIRAWCNFDSTKNSSGTTDSSNTARFLRSSSSNITSVTKTASGKYTVVFSVNMPNANYVVIPALTVVLDGGEDYQRVPKIYNQSISGFDIAFWTGGSGSSTNNPASGTFIVIG